MSKANIRVALVIGSGGIKCTAAIGMWQALLAEDIPVDFIVGCSGGSIYGYGIARGMSVDEMIAESRSVWTAELMQGYTTSLRSAKDGSLRFNERSGLVDDSILNSRLRTLFRDQTFSDLNKPFKVVATDMMSGEKVVLSQGNLFDAVRASIAIPIIFPPWEVDGRLLIDGGASDPLPVDVAIQDGADVILAMGFPLSYRKHFRSMTAVQEQLNSIYTNHLLNMTYAFNNLAHHAEIFPLFPEFNEPVSMFDVDRIPEMIEQGREATLKQLPFIKRAISSLELVNSA